MKAWKWMALLIALGAALRLIGIAYGLPALFNADEPHIVNVAVSFGAGTLNPHHFKYPTLYMYLLFASYGVYFLIWSGLGLLHSVRQFGELFVWNPTGFYLIARLWSAAFSLATLAVVFRAGRALFGERAALFAAAGLCASPVLIESAHAAKPESMMLFLAAGAWLAAARCRDPKSGWPLLACGLLTGAACSAQYTAAPLVSLPIAAWLIGPRCGRALASTAGAIVLGFLLGTPFALLDSPAFLRTLQDMRTVPGMVGGGLSSTWLQVAANVVGFAGPWFPAGVAFLWGAFELARRDGKIAVLLLAPIALTAAALSLSGEGAWQRYLFAAFPGIALVAGKGLDELLPSSDRRRWIVAASLAAMVLPGAWSSQQFDRALLLPDTRTLAAHWIEANIAVGSKILLDQEHASPSLPLSREMTARLFERTRQAGHPKSRVYDLMLHSHPGGGYAIYRVLRSASDLHTLVGEAAFSTQGQAFLDVRGGLAEVRKEGIHYIVLTSFGAEPEHSPELVRFLSETETKGKLLTDIVPTPGHQKGPRIRIYRVDG